ncbi:hypothetical protein KEJ24_09190 [Candidatus Bathyarchaeota archaeon]|nr:hypothetical protein [Candidatus Bathyarchaeota archaeon]
MPTLEEVKNKILTYLLEIGEANASQLEEKAECANKTFLKARQQLEKEGLITKRYEPKPNGGLHAIYSLTPKGKEEAEKAAMKRDYNAKIDKANPYEIERMKLQKRYDEVCEKIAKLQSKCPPIRAVIDELRRLRWDEESIQQVVRQHYARYHKIEEGPSNIILKLISVEELERYMDEHPDVRETILETMKIPHEEAKHKMDMELDVFRYILAIEFYLIDDLKDDSLHILTLKPVKGFFVLWSFKELGDLYLEKQKLERELQKMEWKLKFNLSEEDWRKLNPIIEEVESRNTKQEITLIGKEQIEDFLERYAYSKQPDALIKLIRHYIRRGFDWRRAEQAAKQDLENFKREKPELYYIFA